jgi:glucose/arabinose dehydrogenase
MTYDMRDLSFLACTLGAALATGCGDNGGGTAAETGTATTGADTGSTDATPGTTDPGTTGDVPTTDPTTDPTSTTEVTTEVTSTTDPGTTTDDTTTGMPACPYTPVDGTPGVGLELVASGFDRPVLTVSHPKQPDRLFIVEQGGHIKILEPGMTMAPPDSDDFLYVKVKNENAKEIGAEQGLLGFAFHPDFPDDPRVYVNYNPQDWQGPGPTYIDEYKLDPNDPNKVDPGSRRLVYAVGQPAGNHNGGMISFGPDGMLYIGMGDGGGSNDQFDTGRDPSSQHAKILRIDVEPDGTPDSNKACNSCPMVEGFDFTVPADNPHVGDNAYAPEVYASGMRNPWRFSFDTATGVLYVADVGQNQYEEVSVVEAGGDYGWSDMEGKHCFGGADCDESGAPNGDNADGLTLPIAEYSHDDNNRCSITGADVYHSCQVPAWDGVYFYADYCSSEIFALKWDGSTVDEMDVVASINDERILGSGRNGYGDVFITTVVTTGLNTLKDGKVYRIVPQ